MIHPKPDLDLSFHFILDGFLVPFYIGTLLGFAV